MNIAYILAEFQSGYEGGGLSKDLAWLLIIALGAILFYIVFFGRRG